MPEVQIYLDLYPDFSGYFLLARRASRHFPQEAFFPQLPAFMSREKPSSRTSQPSAPARSLPPTLASRHLPQEAFFPRLPAFSSREKPSSHNCRPASPARSLL